MDQASANSGNSGAGGGGWGTMGGSPGDGIPHQQFDYGGGGTPQPTTENPYQQQQPQTPGSGSITRFATPDMQPQQQPTSAALGGSSYASRSAQAHANYQQQPYSQYNPQQQQNLPLPAQTNAQGGTFVARSTPPYASQQQQQPSAMIPSTPTPQPGSYAARSAQALASHQPQTPSITITPHQTHTALQPSASTSSVGSYAARSAQAYHQQQQPAQAVMQQPQMVVGGGGSYAARSAQAYTAHRQPAIQQSSQAFTPQQPVPAMQKPPQQQYLSPQQQQAQGQSYLSTPQQQPGVPGGSVPQQQYPQQQQVIGNVYGQPNSSSTVVSTLTTPTTGAPLRPGQESPQAQAQQQRWLTEATRKVQEHAYYMRQAMDQNNLPVVLDRAAHMVGELGGPPHGHHHHSIDAASGGPSNTGLSAKLNPKNYYELYMRALEDISTFEDYLFNIAQAQPHDPHVPEGTIQIVDTAPQQGNNIHHHAAPRKLSMRELYDCTQYCPRVVSRLYLQIAAGSALMKSNETGAKWVLNDLAQAVRCEQNPIRGLFVRHYLLQALRNKLPDTPPDQQPQPTDTPTPVSPSLEPAVDVDERDPGTVKDSYEFILGNFMEMNKLWVRIQHLPGEGKNKDVRKRRERERNDLRLLVGTNLVRLSQLECVTSKIYGEIILPQILEHVVVCGDPLSQAYLMDCLVQVFPDEYHIETLPILLNVCPRLRDKVNIRTILQGLMDRLANYLADEELLDESDTNQVKKELARDSFGMFEECVQKVYNARGPKLTPKEVIRLQTALLQFSLKCYPGNMEQISRSLGVCITALRQASASYDANDGAVSNVPEDDRGLIHSLDEASVAELEKLLSIPLDSLALKVLELEQYSNLLRFLPWSNRREVAISMLKAVDSAGSPPQNMKEIEELFSVIEPVIRDENTPPQWSSDQMSTERATSLMAGLGVSQSADTSFTYGAGEQLQSQLPSAFDHRESILVSKLVHVLNHEDPCVLFEMLNIARNRISQGSPYRASRTLVSVVFSALKLVQRLHQLENGTDNKDGDEGPLPDASNECKKEVSSTSDDGKVNGTEEACDAMEAIPDSEQDAKETEEVKVDTTTEAEEGPPARDSQSAPEESKTKAESQGDTTKTNTCTMTISCRKVFAFIQETIVMISKGNAENGVKLYLEISLAADSFSATTLETCTRVGQTTDYVAILYELLSQAYSLYEETITDSKVQQRCIRLMVGTLLSSRSLSRDDYERLITKTAQFAAKVVKKPDQCQLVALCSNLFYPTDSCNSERYNNAQRALECLQRSLKLADACTSANPSNVQLFVDLLEHYVFFFENKNPLITHNYITGLLALIKEHLSNLESSFQGDSRAVAEAKGQFLEVVRYIKRKKNEEATAELFSPVQTDSISA